MTKTWLFLIALLFIFVIFLPINSALPTNRFPNLNDDLVGLWKLDDKTGSSAIDSSPFNASAQLTQNATFNNTIVMVKPTSISSYGFGGAIVNDSTLLDSINTNFSLSGWIYLNNISGDRTMFAKWQDINPIPANNRSWWLGTRNDGIPTFFYDVNPDITSHSITPNPEFEILERRWYHFGIVFNSTGVRFYVNGSLVAQEVSASHTLLNNTINITLGTGTFSSVETILDGNIDELIIWNRTLNDSEMFSIWTSANEFQIVEQTFNVSTFEANTENFQINISYDSIEFISLSANLNYNNTLISPSIAGTGDNLLLSATLEVPSVNLDTNVSFFWEFTLINTTSDTTHINSTSQNQTVLNVNLDDCSINPILLLNYSVRDEGTQDFISPVVANNISFEINILINEILSFNQTINDTNPIEICTEDLGNTVVRLDAQARYSSQDRVAEFDHIQALSISNSSLPINVSLFDLLTTDSQEFLITLRDITFLPVENAVIDITRKYIGEGVFKTVERPLTDSFGQTIGHFVLNDVIYTIIVRKEGVVLATFDNIATFCDDVTIGDCRINLNIDEGTTTFEADTGLNVSFSSSFSISTRTFTIIFNADDGRAKTINVNITKNDAFLNTSLCFNSLTATSGTITCIIPDSAGNVTALARVFVGTELLTQSVFSLLDSSLFGDNSLFLLAGLLIITLPLIVFTAPELMLVFYLLGLAIASLLSLISVGGLIGPMSAFLWFAVASGIIIWKMSRVGET